MNGQQNNYKVAIVDDSEDILEYLETEFQKYQVTKFLRGSELIDKLQDGYEPDAIVLDYKMPDMDGVEVIRRMKIEDFTAPITVLSGAADKKLAISCLRFGVFAILEKPCPADMIINTVEKSICQHRSMLLLEDLLSEFQDFLLETQEHSKSQFDRMIMVEDLLFESHSQMTPEQIRKDLESRKSLRILERSIAKHKENLEDKISTYRYLKDKVS